MSAPSSVRRIVEHGLRMAGRRTTPDLVTSLVYELNQEFGDDIDDRRLREALNSAMRTAGTNTLKPWYVIDAYRGSSGRGGVSRLDEDIPEDAACEHACRDGIVNMSDPGDGTDYVLPCDCAAGRYLRQVRRAFANAPHVHELLLRGHAVNYPLRMSPERAAWVDRQFRAGMPAADIIRKLREARRTA